MFEKKALIFPSISPSAIHTRNSPVRPKEIKGLDKESPMAIADKERISHPRVLENMFLILMAKDTFQIIFLQGVMGSRLFQQQMPCFYKCHKRYKQPV